MNIYRFYRGRIRFHIQLFLMLTIFGLLLTGCVATMTVDRLQWKQSERKYIHTNHIKDVKQVKLLPNGDVEICILGNHINENSDHTIHFTKANYSANGFGVPISEKDKYRSSASYIWLKHNVIQPGCNLNLAEGEVALLRKPDCCEPYEKPEYKELDGLPNWYAYHNPALLPFEDITIGFEHYLHIKLKYPEPESAKKQDDCNPFNAKGDEKRIQIWVPMCHLGESKPRMVIEDYQDYLVERIDESQPFNNFDRVAIAFDIITAPIQWTLCFLTLGAVCSDPPLNI